MIKDNKSIVDDLFKRTSYLINSLKSQISQEDIYFLPIGILLLKWISDSKERFGWKTRCTYEDLVSIFTGHSHSDLIIDEIYGMVKNIEDTNPMLDGIFTDLCFSNLNYIEPEYITDMFSAYKNFEFYDIDSEREITGPFIELFLQQLSNDFNSYAFITPESIKKLLARLFHISENMDIADITCGTGGILSEIVNEYNYLNLDVNTTNFYGQEINFKIALISKINLLLHGINDYSILIKDSLKEPVLNGQCCLDILVSNLPLGLNWNANELWSKDDFKYGIPSTMNAEWLFIQRGLTAVKSNGRAAFIVSKGTLTRKTEIKIRELILKDDLIEAVISLPSNLYGSKTMPIEILIINKNKQYDLNNKVLFIDASKDFYKKERGKNDFKPEHINKIINVYQNCSEIDGYSKIVDISMIERHNFELDSSLYINNFSANLKDLKMKSLSEAADIKRGLQLSKNDMDNSKNSNQNPYYYIKISDINNETIEFNKTTEKVNNLSENKIQAYELKPNDILISARGTLIKLAIYEHDMPPSVFSGNILIIRVKHDYNPYFLKFYLNSSKGREIISSMQGGSTIVALNPNKLKDMLVPDISLDEQNALAERIKSNETTYKQRIQQAQNIYEQNLKAIDEEINYYINY